MAKKRSREIAGVVRRYEWKLAPTAGQAATLWQQARMSAELWNALLEMCETIYQRGVQRTIWTDADGNEHVGISRHGLADVWYDRSMRRRTDVREGDAANGSFVPGSLPTEFTMGYWISDMLAECPEWRQLSTWTPRRIANSLHAAYEAFFRRAREGAGAEAGPPQYKRVSAHGAIPHRTASGCKFEQSSGHERFWMLSCKGISGTIAARGIPPSPPNEWMDVDLINRHGIWWASAAMALERPRAAGNRPLHIRFDLIDGFALVDNMPDTPVEFHRIAELDAIKDERLSAFDNRWPRGRRLGLAQRLRRRAERAEIGVLEGQIARLRRNTLHVWTARIVSRASRLTIIAPPIKKSTKTSHGNKHEWGVSVETVSKKNRTALSYAPGMAIQMLKYKSAEAGIPCHDVTDPDSESAVIGEKLVAAGKAVRRAKRAIRREEQ